MVPDVVFASSILHQFFSILLYYIFLSNPLLNSGNIWRIQSIQIGAVVNRLCRLSVQLAQSSGTGSTYLRSIYLVVLGQYTLLFVMCKTLQLVQVTFIKPSGLTHLLPNLFWDPAFPIRYRMRCRPFWC